MSSDKDQKFYPGGWTPEQWEQASNFKQPVGFPWALVIQILMAILTYLIQRAVTKSERDVLAEMKSKLVRETGGTYDSLS